jgi:hypothetical protein
VVDRFELGEGVLLLDEVEPAQADRIARPRRSGSEESGTDAMLGSLLGDWKLEAGS